MNTLEDKLGLLTQTKKDLKLVLGIKENVPFSDYKEYLPFTPFRMFTGNKIGVWLDPSDLSTMFQDAAGTIPVTTNGSPVGLILDKSQGLELGNELSTVKTYESIRIANQNPSSGFFTKIIGVVTQGLWYKVTIDVKDYAGKSTLGLTGSSYFKFENLPEQSRTQNSTISFIAKCKESGDILLYTRGVESGGANEATFDNISIREIKGNHASQSVSASRPTYKTDGILHWLSFDGVDDFLSLTDTLDLSEGVFAIGTSFTNSSTLNIILSSQSIGYISVVGGTWQRSGAGMIDTNLQVISNKKYSVIGDIATNSLYVKNSEGLEGLAENTGAGLSKTKYIFAFSSESASKAKGNLYGMLLSKSDITENQKDSILSYYDNKAGVTI